MVVVGSVHAGNNVGNIGLPDRKYGHSVISS